MSCLNERFRQTNIGRELSWRAEQARYNRTRVDRARSAETEAEQLIQPIFEAARYNPGSPEAKKLILVGANVTSHVISEVCAPGKQFYLNGVMDSVRDLATDNGDLNALKQTRQTFLRSDLYREYFYLNSTPGVTKAMRDTAGAVALVDEVLFGGVALDKKGITDLDIADKKGTTDFKMQTFITGQDEDTLYTAHGVLPAADAGIYSIAEMSASSHKGVLSLEYSLLAAGAVASIPRYMGAATIARFYGLEPHPTTTNPLFQERINEIIKETLTPTQ